MAKMKYMGPVKFNPKLCQEQRRLTKHLGERTIKRSVTCKKDQVQETLDRYIKDGFSLVKKARNHGLYFIDFKKTV